MAIVGFYLKQERFHILRGGQSLPLIDYNSRNSIIYIFGPADPDAGSYLPTDNNVSVTFTPMFKGTLQNGIYTGSNVSFDMSTGVVTVDQVAPPVKLRNFYVEIELLGTSDGNSISFKKYVRYEIHDSIAHAWLTPNVLELQRNRPYQKFSIYVEFDDGIMADFTKVKDITWSSANQNVNEFGRLLINPTDSDGDEIEITATLPAEFNNVEAKGNMKILPAYGGTNTYTMELVNTGNSPGAAKKDEIPNVLIIPEGYRVEDKDKFDAQVDDIVERLSKSKITAPFDHLSGAINYWKLFLPSRDSGITWLSEVYIYNDNLNKYAKRLRFPKPSPFPVNATAIADWTIRELLYYVGLPIPEFKNLSRNNIRNIWQNTMRLHDDEATNNDLIQEIDNGLIDIWKSYSDRRLLEEKSTLFGLKFGRKHQAMYEESDRINLIEINGNRGVSRIGLDSIFSNAVDEDGNSLSGLWEIGVNNSIKNKDFDNVVLLTNVNHGRALNDIGYLISPSVKQEVPKVERVNSLIGVTGDSRAMRLKGGRLRNRLDFDRRGTFIHELCHSFGLGDEYGEDLNNIYGLNVIDRYGNLELDSHIINNGNYNGNLIKWRWHRIEKCAILSASGELDTASTIRINTIGKQARQFAVDDEVFLRERTLNTVLPRNPRLSVLLRVTGVADDHLICELVNDTTDDFIDAMTFDRHSIIYKPKRAVGSAYHETDFPFAEMITKNVRDFITNNNRPLSPTACVKNSDSRTPPDALPELPGTNFCFKNKAQIVGLYHGGLTYHCGVFHPTGSCMMRSHAGKIRTTELCAVCRYVLTDRLDPSKHPEVDLLYKTYPEI